MGSTIPMESKRVHEEKEENLSPTKRRKFTSSSTTMVALPLPSDAIYEVLTRVDLNTIYDGCRWVCKDWQTLTYDSNFKHIHSQRTRTIYGYFLQYEERYSYNTSFVSLVEHSPPIPSPCLNFLPKDAKIEASTSQGLLCCVSEKSHRIPSYYICKPMTQQWRMIPNPKTRFLTEKISMVIKRSDPLHYKIIRFSRPKSCVGYHCEIFDSNNWAWKLSKDVKLPFLVSLSIEPGIFVNGAFHWLTNNDQIFAFNVDNESWKTITLPQEVTTLNNDRKTLVECEGKIAIFYWNDFLMELWIMEDYTKETWKKKYGINLESLHKEIGFSNLFDLYTMNVAVMKSYGKVIWYNCKSNSYTMKKGPYRFITHHAFQSNLVPCNLGR